MTAAAAGERIVRGQVISSIRCPPVFKQSTRGMTPAQANGLRYERKVARAFSLLAKSLDPAAKIEHQPWFRYYDDNGPGACAPDIILSIGDGTIITVVEIKYTYTPRAADKLARLYVPVVNAALKPVVIRSLVVCKNLTSDAPEPIAKLADGTQFSVHSAPIYQWLGHGPLIW